MTDLPADEAEPQLPIPLRLHIHVNEPWAFERQNGVTSMVGSTVDYLDPENDEWGSHAGADIHAGRRAV